MCTASLPCEVRCLACAARSGARHASHRGLLFHYVRAFVPHASSPAATAVWRVRKSLESVLHFHPSATIMFHYLSGDALKRDRTLRAGIQRLQAAGYNVQIHSGLHLARLLGNLTTADAIREWEHGRNWPFHASEFARYALLWRHGGVYLDTDVIFARPLAPSSLPSFVAYENPQKTRIDGAVLGFARGHELPLALLREAITEYTDESSRPTDSAVGPRLLTRVVRSRGRPWGINVLSWKAFNPVPRARIGKWCFEQLARRGNRTLPLPKSTYALHLSARLTLQYHNVQEGTLCHRLYSSHCVLCD